MRIKRLAAVVAAATALLAASAGSAAALPVIYNFPTAVAASVLNPGGAPAGANDTSCTPSAAHPRPVVLVNGTFANQIDSWNAISPLLKNNGYCVYTFNYGGHRAGQIGADRPDRRVGRRAEDRGRPGCWPRPARRRSTSSAGRRAA